MFSLCRTSSFLESRTHSFFFIVHLSLCRIFFCTVDCLSEVEGECYTFLGTLFVFGDLANDRQAEEVVLPAVQRYIQGRSDWTGIDSRLLDIVYVVSVDGELVPPPPLPGTPSEAPTPFGKI